MKYCARSSLHIYNSSRNFCSGYPYPNLKNGETEAQRKEVLAWVTCNSGAWDFRPVSQASGALCCGSSGRSSAEMWREGPKQLPLAQGPELQHRPSQKLHQPFAPGPERRLEGQRSRRGFLVDQHSLLAHSLPWGPGDLSPRSQGPGPPLQGGVGDGGSWDWFGAGRGVSWAPRKEQSRWTPEIDQEPPGSRRLL